MNIYYILILYKHLLYPYYHIVLYRTLFILISILLKYYVKTTYALDLEEINHLEILLFFKCKKDLGVGS